MSVREKDGTVREAKRPILIGDLFSMTAGFNYNMKAPSIIKAGEMTGGKFDTLTVVRQLASEPLSFDPGDHWQYSLCHDVLAGFVEAVSGMKFRDYVKKNIFEPLEMEESVYHPTEAILKNMASQYSFVPKGASTNFDIVEAQKYGSTADGNAIGIQQILFGKLVHNGVNTARFVKVFHIGRSCGSKVAKVGSFCAYAVCYIKVYIYSAFVGNGGKMKHTVGRTSQCHINGKSVHKCFFCHNIQRADILFKHFHNRHACVLCQFDTGRVYSGNSSVALKSHT
jgi:hypothetical protein